MSSSLIAVRDDGRMSSPGPRSGGPTSRRSFTSAHKLEHLAAYEVALENGAAASYRVDSAREIDEGWLDGVGTVGVTSGASVPEILVREVIDFLAARGYSDCEEVVTAEEDLLFSLPKELRKDIKIAKQQAAARS